MYVHDYVYIYIFIYAIYALFNVVAVCFTLPRLLLISSLFIYRQISCFMSANPVFEGATETPLLHLFSDMYGAVLNSPYWHCSMLVPLSTLLTTKSCLNARN